MIVPASVAVVTLGCARNEVDSEELAGRLAGEGWRVVADPDAADAVLVNTCGFIEAAKRDSVEQLLAVADGRRRVVAVGCLAERYGAELAEELPEADAVLSFDDYGAIADRLDDVLAGRPLTAHRPRDRRTLLPITPVARRRPAAAPDAAGPGLGYAALTPRLRLSSGPVASLKLASGCDRRCAFCAIPRFRGAFVSRPPEQVLADARALAATGVSELLLVSENSTSYGKDLGDLRLLESLLPQLADLDGIERVRLSYLQPAELRPSLLAAICDTPGVVPYFDLSFQHSSPQLLRRMRRFGGTDRFLELLTEIRRRRPGAGVRSNVIVGFPGETEADVAELERFLTSAGLDAVGVFGYSDEDGTEAATLPGSLDAAVIQERVDRLLRLTEELTAQRAEERIGQTVQVLVESVEDGIAEGRAAHQAPEVDGTVTLPADRLGVGDLVPALVTGSAGVDLEAVPLPVGLPGGR